MTTAGFSRIGFEAVLCGGGFGDLAVWQQCEQAAYALANNIVIVDNQ
jgi:hypothetical protein